MCRATSAAAGCCEGAMGDPGSHDMVREGLLSPEGKSEWEVREPVWRVLPGTGTGLKSAVRFPVL